MQVRVKGEKASTALSETNIMIIVVRSSKDSRKEREWKSRDFDITKVAAKNALTNEWVNTKMGEDNHGKPHGNEAFGFKNENVIGSIYKTC